MSERMTIAKAYEAAYFAGKKDEVGSYFTDDIVYWVAGPARLGGEWKGRARVLEAMWNREPGLGAADWGYEEVWRNWYEADDRIIVEIREKSWLKSAPKDVMDARTCVVLRFAGTRIAEMRDYTDAWLYGEFLAGHQAELPKFR
ncbi:MAG TPA: nuclear transport factor 2 family protein [Gemmatimonadales bacterium]|jgi:ketosteroid isomerase-like protein